MHRLTTIALSLVITILVAFPPITYASPATDNQTLINIDGKKYSINDYKIWWKNWQEKGMSFPETPDSFINWKLLANEARQMDMSNAPELRRKVAIFLKVRSLMYLKQEEVTSKIAITEKETRKLYQEQYTPRRSFQSFYFTDNETATNAYEELRQGKITAKDLQEKSHDTGGAAVVEEKSFRPNQINPEWAWHDTMLKLKEGEASKPFPFKKGFIILHLNEIIKGGEEDYQKKRKIIKRKLWDHQRNILTIKLDNKLREKYQLHINQELLESINIDTISEKLADKDVLTSTAMTLTLKQFAQKVLSERQLRKRMNFKSMDPKEFNQMVLNNIITQTLITKEALNRHYENKPPLQATYNFYYNNRLNIEMELHLSKTAAKKNSAEAISSYYQKNIAQFSNPASVTYAEAKGEDRKIKKIWLGILTGEDFSDLAEKHLGHKPQSKTIAVDHLDPTTKDMIKSLTTNELSPPFKSAAQSAIVKLIKRQAAIPEPFESVKQAIAQRLKQQEFKTLRDNYLTQLKNRMSIDVNQKAWKTLQKELGEKR